MPLVQALRCVACGSGGLRASETSLECPGCGRCFPIAAGVPVMISDMQSFRGPMVSLDQARATLEAIGLPRDEFGPLRVRRASAARVRLPSQDDPDRPTASACRMSWENVPRLAAPGASIIARVHLQNTGGAPLRSSGEGRAMIAARWSGPDGASVKADDVRTMFTADLPPGQSRTMAARLRAPDRPGWYTAELSVVEESIRWMTPALGRLPIQVRPGVIGQEPAAWITEDTHRPTADRAGHAGQLLAWLAAPGRRPAVLEIGSGTVQPLPDTQMDVVTADDDLSALQLAGVAAQHRGKAARVVNAAAADLPFPPAFFDAVAITAPIESWRDPAACLCRARSHIRPGGFIALFGQQVGGTDFEADAGQAGLSETDFARLFRQAHLVPKTVVIGPDHRLSARLCPEEADLG